MIENGFRAITYFVIHLWSWDFIHLLPIGQEYAYLFWDQKVKGQGHGALMTDSVIHLRSINFIYLLPMSQGCALLISVSKGQGHGALVIENGFRTISDSVIHLRSLNFMHLLPMSQGCAVLILGSKGKGHGALVIENGPISLSIKGQVQLWPNVCESVWTWYKPVFSHFRIGCILRRFVDFVFFFYHGKKVCPFVQFV